MYGQNVCASIVCKRIHISKEKKIYCYKKETEQIFSGSKTRTFSFLSHGFPGELFGWVGQPYSLWTHFLLSYYPAIPKGIVVIVWLKGTHPTSIAAGVEGKGEWSKQHAAFGLVSEVVHFVWLYSISNYAVSFLHLCARSFGKCNLTIYPGRKWWWILVYNCMTLPQETPETIKCPSKEEQLVNVVPIFGGILDLN